MGDIREKGIIEAEIAKLKQELATVIEIERGMANGDPKAIAVYLHDKLCNSNHSDQCGWYYEVHGEKHDWANHSHKHWLARAEKFIDKWGKDDILTKLEMALSL